MIYKLLITLARHGPHAWREFCTNLAHWLLNRSFQPDGGREDSFLPKPPDGEEQ